MKLIFILAGFLITSPVHAQYEVTKGTFSVSALSVSTSVVTLVSLPASAWMKSTGAKWSIWSTTIENVTASTIAYTLDSSTFTAPGLTCANGVLIGTGSDTAPVKVEEKFEDLYLWAIGCGDSANTIRRIFKGK